MKPVMLITFLMIFVFKVNCQNFNWLSYLPNSNNPSNFKSVMDDLGNLYISHNNLLGKFDSSGNLLWQHSLNVQLVRAMKYKNGNIYICGSFINPLSYNGTILAYASGTDGFWMKVSKMGILENYEIISGVGYERLDDIAIDSQNNIYVIGGFGEEVIFSSSLQFDSNDFMWFDMFIAKYDSNGNVLWARFPQTPLSEYAISIAIDEYDFIYYCGEFFNTLIFDPPTNQYSVNSNGSADIFLAKMDTTGNYIWVKNYGGIEYDKPYQLEYYNNHLYLSADYIPPLVFDTIFVPTGSFEDFNCKIDTSGKVKKIIAGPVLGGMVIDTLHGYLYIVGRYFQGNTYIDDGQNVYNLMDTTGYNYYIVKLDEDYIIQWISFISHIDFLSSIRSLDFNMISGKGYITGRLISNIYFQSYNNTVIQDSHSYPGIAYIAQFTDSTLTTSVPVIPFKDEKKIFTISPNPTSGEITITTTEEKYEVKINDLNGKKLLSKKLSGSATLDLSAIRSKTVVVEIYMKGKKVQAEKIVIQ